MEILRVYQKDGFTITEWSKDRQTVSHTTKVAITSDEYEAVEYPNLEITPTPTIEDRLEAIEQTSAYTHIQVEYLATLAEINNGL